MNEEEVEQLYEKLSEEHGIPMPVYFIYERKPEITEPMPGLRITVSLKIGSFFTLSSSIAEDLFGVICLSKGSKGILKDEAVHEFIHYFDHLVDVFNFLEAETPTELAYKIRAHKASPPLDEKSVRSRTRSQIRRLKQ